MANGQQNGPGHPGTAVRSGVFSWAWKRPVSRWAGIYGPSNPQLTHLYLLENFLQSSSRQINTWWQFGQLNLTAFVPGRMGLLQEVQCDSENPSGICFLTVDSPFDDLLKLEPSGQTAQTLAPQPKCDKRTTPSHT